MYCFFALYFPAFANHAHLNDYDLSSLMACFSGGAPLPPELCRQFEEKTGAIIFEGYGLTETTPVVTTNPGNRETRKIGYIGFPLPGTMVKIMDLENDTRELPRGEDGGIAVCGPQVMKGYWKRPDAKCGEFVKAFIKLKEGQNATPEEIQMFCKENMAGYK